MEEYHLKWPEYDFFDHKGYGTKKHLEALAKYGPCEIHRRSFEHVEDLNLEPL
jgi:ribonuclease HII